MSKKDKDIVTVEKPKKEKKKSRGTGKFFLGWFIGTIFNIAVLVGAGFWFYKNGTISGVEKTFGFEIDVLSDDAKHLTIEKLVGDVLDVATNYDQMSIEELADGLGVNLSSMLSVQTTAGEKTYKFKGLDVTTVIKGKLGEAGDNMQKVIDDLSLGDIESTFEITLPDYEFLNALKDTPLKDLSTATDGIFDGYTLNKMCTEFGVSFNSVDMLKNLLDTPFSDLPAELQELKVEDVLDTTGATGVLKAISGFKITELDTEIQTLKLQDIFTTSEISGNIVLNALKTSTFSTLPNDINNLKIGTLYPDATNKILIALQDYSVTNLTAAFEQLKVKDVIDMEKVANASYNSSTDPEYMRYEAQGIWAFINGDTLLKNFGDVSPNLAEIALGELQYQGLIDQTLDLSKVYDGKALSLYTLNEFLDAVIGNIA